MCSSSTISASYEAIKAAGNLPSPSGVALKILELTQGEQSTVEEIAAAVELDPAISGRLLKLVNSPLAGQSRKVASVSRAAALLGVRTVGSLALSFSLVSDHRRGKCAAFDYELFWSESVARAVAARHLACLIRSFSPEEAFTVGLLSQIGRLALAAVFPEQYASTLRSVATSDPDSLCAAEKTSFGIDHHELAAEMMADWHMPVVFREAVRVRPTGPASWLATSKLACQSVPQADAGGQDIDPGSRVCQFARILRLVGNIAPILTQPTVYYDTLSALAQEANSMGISPYHCHEMLDAIAQEWRDAGRILSVRTRHVPPLAEVYAQARQRQERFAERDEASPRAVVKEGHSVEG
jgi:HD-like signal output (HDOD) protein